MNIEDFKTKVAELHIGDELKLEELCAEWNACIPEEPCTECSELERELEAAEDEVERLQATLRIMRETLRAEA